MTLDADTLISIAVAVGMILAVGLVVLAVEHFRPRGSPALVNLETGKHLPLKRREGAAVALDGAEVRYGKGRFYIQSRDSPVLLNGQPVQAARLVHGDRVTVGGVTFWFRQQQSKGQVE